MENNSKKEIALSALLVFLIVALLNPFHLFMSGMVHMLVLGLLIVIIGLFVGIIFHEKALDEREQMHRAQSARIGYSIGLLVVTAGVLLQTLKGMNDPWLLLALLGLVLGKVVSRAVFRKYE